MSTSRVPYARNGQGKVVGRQLLAIADDKRLICFHVYPHSCSKSVKAFPGTTAAAALCKIASVCCLELE